MDEAITQLGFTAMPAVVLQREDTWPHFSNQISYQRKKKRKHIE